MLEKKRVRNKALRSLLEGDGSKIDARWRRKAERILAELNVAVAPMELDLPGHYFHELKGDRRGTFSVRVSPNWRITFRWDDAGPYDVDLEDYHG